MDNEHELYHYGILGMKWGVRRYQNPDGTLTAAGRKRYQKDVERIKKQDARTKSYGSLATESGRAMMDFSKGGDHEGENMALNDFGKYFKKERESRHRSEDLINELVSKYGERNVNDLNPEYLEREEVGLKRFFDRYNRIEKAVSDKDLLYNWDKNGDYLFDRGPEYFLGYFPDKQAFDKLTDEEIKQEYLKYIEDPDKYVYRLIKK